MKYLSLTAALLILTGCVTPQRFDSMGQSLARQVTSSVSAVLDSQEGKISVADAREALKDAAKGVVETTAKEGDHLQENTDALLNFGVGLIPEGTPAAALAMLALNYYRNRNRRKRGEVVAVEAAEKGAKA